MFGGNVGGQVRRGQQPSQRRGVDDVAVALGDHVRQGRLDAVDDATQVDIDAAVPMRNGEVERVTAHTDAGVIEDHVQAAVLGYGLVDHGCHGIGIADIQFDARRPDEPWPRQLRSERCHTGCVDVGEDQIDPLVGKGASERSPDP